MAAKSSGSSSTTARRCARSCAIRKRRAPASTSFAEISRSLPASPLTGPEALSVAEQVDKIAAALGKSIRGVPVPESAARAGMRRAGTPERMIDPLLELLAFVRAGHAMTLTPTVEQLLGRKARTFDEWLRDHVAAFQ